MKTIFLSGALLGPFCPGACLSQDRPASAERDSVPISLPSPNGRYAVGALRYAWTDSTRAEIGTADTSDRRTLVVRVWYPAERGTQPIEPYLPQLEQYVAAGSLSERTAGRLRRVRHAAATGASIIKNPARLPLLIFSTGNGEMEFMYTALAEELASQGYVFALIPHAGVADVVYPDGRSLRRYPRLFDPKPPGWEASLPATMPLNLRRALYDTMYTEAASYLTADVGFVIDRMQALDLEAGSPFRERLDLDRIVTLGHSYGGNVAIEACHRHPRVRACVQFDGSAFGPTRDEGLAKPYMMLRPAFMNEGTPRGLSQVQLMGAMRHDAYEVNVEGAVHRSFMDAEFLSPPTPRPSSLGADRVLQITSAYVRAFLGKYLDGRDSPLLSKRSRTFPEVHLRILKVDFGPRTASR